MKEKFFGKQGLGGLMAKGNLDVMVQELNIENIQELPDDVAMLSIKKVVELC